ncbi:MAG: DUF1360 domain-containing protein [Pseudonocardia sp.]|nr:DUF1360 domain-containing protein [Pseudonocardia sp.]
MNATETVVDFLAVARLTRLVQEDEVPFGPARELVLDLYPDAKATELLRCPWCVSPWLAAFVALARWRYPRAWPVVARIAAGSAVAGHLAQLAER